MHRLIVCSSAYRQSSARRPGPHAADPDNRLLARFSVRRPVPVASETVDKAGRRTPVPTTDCRRSVYLEEILAEG
jgi:hypothetical protein